MSQQTSQQSSFTKIAESLLGRSLTAQDGIECSIIEETTQRLEGALPEPLKEFYLLVGKLPQFMSSFQQFALPEQLHIKDDLLIFLEESEDMCYWGVDKQGQVFQCEEDGTRYDLKLDIQHFLILMLYYQVAQSAEYAYYTNLLDEEIETLFVEDDWQSAIDHDDLVVYHLNNNLIWYFLDEDSNVLDDMVYFSSLLEVPTETIKRYGLEAL